MPWTNPLFLTPAIIGVACMVASILMRRYPPKEINYLYGYRTAQSMLSQERWDFAQQVAAQEFLKWGALLSLLALSGLFINIDIVLGLILGIALGIGLVIIPWVRTERALKQRFGETGAEV